jgi:hypothetical protein
MPNQIADNPLGCLLKTSPEGVDVGPHWVNVNSGAGATGVVGAALFAWGAASFGSSCALRSHPEVRAINTIATRVREVFMVAFKMKICL